jgi:hypothetical protein
MKIYQRCRPDVGLAALACAAICGCGIDSSTVTPAKSFTRVSGPSVTRPLIYTNQGLPSSPTHAVNVFTYPHGKFVHAMSGLAKSPGSLCSDAAGDVYVTATISVQSSYVYEFGPGDTEPIRTLENPGYGSACSVDPTTGNLAVANWDASYHGLAQGDIAIFAPGSNTPTLYGIKKMPEFFNCAYDGQGNLLADGIDHLAQNALAILPRGSTELTELKFNKYLMFPGPMQWDGHYFAVGYGPVKGELYQVTVSGSEAKAVKTIKLKAYRFLENDNSFWIHRDTLVAPVGPKGSSTSLGFWKYPAGGQVTRVIKNLRKGYYTVGVTVTPNVPL